MTIATAAKAGMKSFFRPNVTVISLDVRDFLLGFSLSAEGKPSSMAPISAPSSSADWNLFSLSFSRHRRISRLRAGGELRVPFFWVPGLLAFVFHGHAERRLSFKRNAAGDHFVEDDSQRIDVRTSCPRLSLPPARREIPDAGKHSIQIAGSRSRRREQRRRGAADQGFQRIDRDQEEVTAGAPGAPGADISRGGPERGRPFFFTLSKSRA